MTASSPNRPYAQRRFSVFSRERTGGIPAGRYEALDEAVAHAETVTYGMYVFDRVEWKVVYRNGRRKDE